MYRFPYLYDQTIETGFSRVRDDAFRYFLARHPQAREGTCLDVACGTGLSTVWFARECPGARVVGIDADANMLRTAKGRIRALGLDDRCALVLADATKVTAADLPRSQFDLITCSLGYSVMPSWQETFWNTLELLRPNGIYVIFDQFVEGLAVPDFASDQSRRSWLLLEAGFHTVETKWFGQEFIAIGTQKRSVSSPPQIQRISENSTSAWS